MAFGLSAGAMAGIGAIGGAVISGTMANEAADTQAEAAQNAANTSAAASRYSSDIQKKIYDQTREDQAPWRDAGTKSLNKLLELIGVGGAQADNERTRLRSILLPQHTYSNGVDEVTLNRAIDNRMRGWKDQQATNGYGSLLRDFSLQDYQADPGYSFRLAEGKKALERSAAARGGLNSGRAMKDILRFGQDNASQEYQNAYNRFQSNQANKFNRLASMAGVGQTANSALQTAGTNYANSVGNAAMTAAGNSATAQLVGGMGRASAYQGWGNALGRVNWGNMFPSGGTLSSGGGGGWDGYSGPVSMGDWA